MNSPPDPAAWKAVQDLLDQALERAPQERSAFLAASGADPAIVKEVESLLAACEDSTGFLDEGALAFADPFVTAEFTEVGAYDAGPTPPGSASIQAAAGDLFDGRYRLIEELGRGGMGVVHRALDTRLRREVALKFLPASAVQDEAAKVRLAAEARAASAIDHPNVAAVFDFGEGSVRAGVHRHGVPPPVRISETSSVRVLSERSVRSASSGRSRQAWLERTRKAWSIAT